MSILLSAYIHAFFYKTVLYLVGTMYKTVSTEPPLSLVHVYMYVLGRLWTAGGRHMLPTSGLAAMPLTGRLGLVDKGTKLL